MNLISHSMAEKRFEFTTVTQAVEVKIQFCKLETSTRKLVLWWKIPKLSPGIRKKIDCHHSLKTTSKKFWGLNRYLQEKLIYWTMTRKNLKRLHRNIFQSKTFISNVNPKHGSYERIVMLEKCGRPDLTVFHLIWVIGTYGNWKNQNPGGRFGATS